MTTYSIHYNKVMGVYRIKAHSWMCSWWVSENDLYEPFPTRTIKDFPTMESAEKYIDDYIGSETDNTFVFVKKYP